MTATLTIIEPGIGSMRAADIGADGLPLALRFHDDVTLSPLGGLYSARITGFDRASDLAFADLGGGLAGVINLRRGKLLNKQAAHIGECVTEGQRLLVQVVAEPSNIEAGKSLTLTPRPRLKGRYCIVEAGGARLNFSKDLPPKLVKDMEAALQPHAAKAVIIVRGRAALAPDAAVREVAALVAYLEKPADKAGLLYAPSPLEAALLDVPDNSTTIEIEGGDAFAEAKALAARHWPDLADKLALFQGEQAAFEHYGVTEAIEEALAPRIDLPSGGWITITPTPALTVVDVNMGAALKGRTASDAKVQVNMEAALAVMYHLHFQNIGGLIVVDFIDMSQKGAARDLMALIDEAGAEDSVPVQHTGLSAFGLMEFSRARSGLSLRDRLHVKGTPALRVAGVALDMLRRGLSVGRNKAPGALVLSGPQGVTAWLKAHPAYVAELASATQRTVEILLGTESDVFLRG